MTEPTPTEAKKTVKAFVVPAPLFAAIRQIIGRMPHDEVGPVCSALDNQCKAIEE